MARTAAVPAVMYGCETFGVSDSCLHNARVKVAMVASPAAAGRNPVLTLLALDGSSGTLDPAFEARFEVPRCPYCQGERLKPDVVFFGENVAPSTAAKAMAAVEQSEGLLVVGSSLMAYSAFRLCKAMAEQGKPVIAINLGKTRGDELLQVKIETSCEQLLPLLQVSAGDPVKGCR